ncbi:MAG: hypothetical protein GY747_06560 [Planctomycetes bacterium]|nr:hypothetical protein [Planctomycetota bacterium]MCP4771434.1 hypothetical protein [Planctomycetota bacterium]MCP4861871.1 hypothetical protein [Planctomycetota bacterium]
MVPTFVRLLMFVVTLVIGGNLLYNGDSWAYAAFAIAALIAVGHFRFGSVMLAFRAVQAEQYEKAHRLLKSVQFPGLLTTSQRFFFELASGAIAGHHQQLDLEEQHYRTALEFAANNERDRAVVELELAELVAQRGAAEEAIQILEQAREHQHTPSVQEGIDRLTETLKADQPRS